MGEASAQPASGVCPEVGSAATAEGSGKVIASKPIVQNGQTLCDVTAEASGFVAAPSAPAKADATTDVEANQPYVANLGNSSLPAVPATQTYYQWYCNIEVAGHEQFHIEMWDQHLHQRYQYNGSTDVRLMYDGIGRGSGRKTVQWWTDVLWGGSATWVGIDYGSRAEGDAPGYYSSGPFYADVLEICTVYASGSWSWYWRVRYTKPPGWHLHDREYGGYPPDW